MTHRRDRMNRAPLSPPQASASPTISIARGALTMISVATAAAHPRQHQ